MLVGNLIKTPIRYLVDFMVLGFLVNALSEHLSAKVKREGKLFQQEYQTGKPSYDVKVIGESTETVRSYL